MARFTPINTKPVPSANISKINIIKGMKDIQKLATILENLLKLFGRIFLANVLNNQTMIFAGCVEV